MKYNSSQIQKVEATYQDGAFPKKTLKQNYKIHLPLDVAYGPRCRQRNTSVKFHKTRTDNGKIPAYQLFGNELVCSPEYCLFSLSHNLTTTELSLIASELCASFSYRQIDGSFELYNFKPATSINKIEAFAKKYLSCSAQKKFMNKLKYTIENALSPAEIVLALKLIAHRNSGGYEFPAPLLNHKIKVRQGVSKMLDKYAGSITEIDTSQLTHMRPDLYWPKHKLAVEYDSNYSHASNEQLNRDSVRRSLLKSNGIDVITVTHDQLFDYRKFDLVASSIAKAMGKRRKIQELKAEPFEKFILNRKLKDYLITGDLSF
ncbi:MAG: hypothetical protein HUJ63_10150 [Enterococcus sp.]|nr:hypothetical protein [Enterococcus sp.]